jgi:hypothetical protein
MTNIDEKVVLFLVNCVNNSEGNMLLPHSIQIVSMRKVPVICTTTV